MLELGQIIGTLAAVVLLVAIAAWVNVGRSPVLQPVDGPPDAKRRPAEMASRLLMLAFGLSMLAALLAAVGSIGL